MHSAAVLARNRIREIVLRAPICFRSGIKEQQLMGTIHLNVKIVAKLGTSLAWFRSEPVHGVVSDLGARHG